MDEQSGESKRGKSNGRRNRLVGNKGTGMTVRLAKR